ncbi:hypothetical protein BLOT_003058 [Blomia tropicalis]|nr:hypothetical protein BLOT_003058 [Blomia tropicalis]
MEINSTIRPAKMLTQLTILFMLAMVTMAAVTNIPGQISKKSFTGIGCLGRFDRSKFARLDRICDECSNIYRNVGMLNSCRDFCFKNEAFPACVDALLLTHEQKELDDIVTELLG